MGALDRVPRIARLWHGRTAAADLAPFCRYVERTGVRDYLGLPGNGGVLLLRRMDGDVGHVVMLSLWESMQAIAAFNGPDTDRARYYPEDARYLLEMEPTVIHFDVDVDAMRRAAHAHRP